MVEEEWVRALVEERTRILAEPEPDPQTGELLMVCSGRKGRWALPLAHIRRVEVIPSWTPVPGRGDAFLGIATIGGALVLLADLDALAAHLPPRTGDRPGHVVALREGDVALAVDRAESILALRVDDAPPITLGRGVARPDDGGSPVVVLDPGAVAALVLAQAEGGGRP